MIDDEMYEICKDCPYCYKEVNQCMYGEEGVPDNLEKKCNKGVRKMIIDLGFHGTILIGLVVLMIIYWIIDRL